MELPVAGQVVIVTGAGQGIGRSIALRLAQDGMHVVVADKQAQLAEAVAAELREAGRRALSLAIDVASAADRQRMIDTTLAEFGRLDALVNNAGILRVALPVDVDEAHWDAVMAVNAKAVYFCCVLALRHMVAIGGGRVVNIASIAGKTASTIYHPIYNVSKAAVIAMTKTLAMAHAADGVRVNAVCPGVIETPMQDAVDAEFARVTGRPAEAIRAERVGRIPLGATGTAADVAGV
ncbi:MAG TPA: SDR family NAD(P)-dependent oxidoreductase, partial [Roseiflexaceae bacterium]|nr:SDR family NAD(P)-dependent oxidoreductase [Roseiflexaceae bacterium]